MRKMLVQQTSRTGFPMQPHRSRLLLVRPGSPWPIVCRSRLICTLRSRLFLLARSSTFLLPRIRCLLFLLLFPSQLPPILILLMRLEQCLPPPALDQPPHPTQQLSILPMDKRESTTAARMTPISFFRAVERGVQGNQITSFSFLVASDTGDMGALAGAVSFLAGYGTCILGHWLHFWVGDLFSIGQLLDLVIS